MAAAYAADRVQIVPPTEPQDVYPELLTISRAKAKKFARIARSRWAAEQMANQPFLFEWYDYVSYLGLVKTCESPMEFLRSPDALARMDENEEVYEIFEFEMFHNRCFSKRGCDTWSQYLESTDPKDRIMPDCFWQIPLRNPDDLPAFSTMDTFGSALATASMQISRSYRVCVPRMLERARSMVHKINDVCKGRHAASHESFAITIYYEMLGLRRESLYAENHVEQYFHGASLVPFIRGFVSAMRGNFARASLWYSTVPYWNKRAKQELWLGQDVRFSAYCIRWFYDIRFSAYCIRWFYDNLALPITFGLADRELLTFNYNKKCFLLRTYTCIRRQFVSVDSPFDCKCNGNCLEDSLYADYALTDLVCAGNTAVAEKHVFSIFMSVLLCVLPPICGHWFYGGVNDTRQYMLDLRRLAQRLQDNPWIHNVVLPLIQAVFRDLPPEYRPPNEQMLPNKQHDLQMRLFMLFVQAYDRCLNEDHEGYRCIERAMEALDPKSPCQLGHTIYQLGPQLPRVVYVLLSAFATNNFLPVPKRTCGPLGQVYRVTNPCAELSGGCH